MKRLFIVVGVLAIVGYAMVITESCGNSEGTFEPYEYQDKLLLKASTNESREMLNDGSLWIFIPLTQEEKEIRDPWISDAILSILSEETRIRFFAEGSVLIEDAAISGLILAGAGMESFELSGGLLLVDGDSWGCIKCCYSDEQDCPGCYCDKDKPDGVIRYVDY